MNQNTIGSRHVPTPEVARSTRSRSPIRMAMALLAIASLCTTAAHAMPIVITTTGVVTSGSDANDLLGAGTNLAGDLYTLSVEYDDPTGGANFYSDGSTIALDSGDPLTGSVSLTIAGHTLTTAIVDSYGATLEEDAYDLASANAGTDAASNYVYAFQTVSTSLPFVASADLQTGLSYLLTAADSGTDSYQFNNPAYTQSINLTGTTSSVVLQAIPEPSSWALCVAGLAALGLRLRRRQRATLAA